MLSANPGQAERHGDVLPAAQLRHELAELKDKPEVAAPQRAAADGKAVSDRLRGRCSVDHQLDFARPDCVNAMCDVTCVYNPEAPGHSYSIEFLEEFSKRDPLLSSLTDRDMHI